jgi:hypothetical protein
VSGKLVIHLFHADDSTIGTGAHLCERVCQVQTECGVALEVYVFGPAEKALADPARTAFRDALARVTAAGVPVHLCRSIAEDLGMADAFTRLGFTLEYARDAFIRYTREGATVISF